MERLLRFIISGPIIKMDPCILGLYRFHTLKWHPFNTYESITLWSAFKSGGDHNIVSEQIETFHTKYAASIINWKVEDHI